MKYDSAEDADSLIYDVRPPLSEYDDAQAADTEPEDAISANADRTILKPWILPTGNAFIKNPEDRHERPEGNPGSDFPFVQQGFDDSSWETVNLPHDWAIAGPFFEGDDADVTGGMERLGLNGRADTLLFCPQLLFWHC